MSIAERLAAAPVVRIVARGAWRMPASTPGSSAARSATPRSAARSPTSTSRSPASPEAAAKAIARGERRARLRALGRVRHLARRRPRQAWQVDVDRAARRDDRGRPRRARLHVGAVAVPLAGGEPLDPHGGLADLERRVLRVVGEGSFADDPLRLLRAARLAAELGLEVDPATAELGPRRGRARRRAGGGAAAGRAAPADRRRRPAARPRAARRARHHPGRPARARRPARRRAGAQPPPRRPRPHAGGARAHARGRGRPRPLRRRARRGGPGAARRAARRRDDPGHGASLRRPPPRHRQAGDPRRARRLRHLHRPRQRGRRDGRRAPAAGCGRAAR